MTKIADFAPHGKWLAPFDQICKFCHNGHGWRRTKGQIIAAESKYFGSIIKDRL